MKIRHGVGNVPMWASVLAAAEKWGVPPWEIAGGDSRVVWFLRWQALERERERANKENVRDQERKIRRNKRHG